MKKFLLLGLVLLSLSSFAQNSVNNYKYVIVPQKFNFLKENDQYMLNSAAKALLEQKGFTVYFDNKDLPEEVLNNRCNALTLDVLSAKKLFSTNLTLLLKDCKGTVLFKSAEGKSREKEYDVAFNAALAEAFNSLKATTYIAGKPEVTTPAVAPVASTVSTTADTQTISLYAQPTAFGFQLVDTSPKIVLTLYKTSAENYFIADKGSDKGIVFKKNDDWIFEYYQNNQLIAEKLLIKF